MLNRRPSCSPIRRTSTSYADLRSFNNNNNNNLINNEVSDDDNVDVDPADACRVSNKQMRDSHHHPVGCMLSLYIYFMDLFMYCIFFTY